jgi:exodeoxyribonuclease VII small subunit
MSKNSQPASFEQALAELEALVSQMESGQLPLEQSLAAYKRGAELLQYCQKSLADVEQQVRILNETSSLQPYIQNDE